MEKDTLFTRIKQSLAPPVFEDEEETRIAGLVHAFLLVTLAGAGLFPIVAAVIATGESRLLLNLVPPVVILIVVGLLALLRRGHVQLISILLSLAVWASFTVPMYVFDGIRDLTLTGYFPAVVMASLVCGRFGVGLVSLLSGLAVTGVFFAERNGIIVTSMTTPPSYLDLAVALITLGTTATLVSVATRKMAQALERARRNEQALTEANLKLESSHNLLREKTRDLERHTHYLEAVNVVARDAASTLESQELFSRVVTLIGERLGFYHTGIFLLDATREWAVLQAAFSEGGQRLLARGHRLRVGQESIVGHVTDRGEACIASDMDASAAHSDHPDLSDTRSEMALPLRVRGKIIGALDVQSTQPEAFDREDMAALQTLADQVAVAIENARLYEAMQRELAERTQAEELMRQAEQRYRDLFEEAPVMYVITRNQEGVPLIADCNQLFLSVLGYTRAEVVGQPLADFYTPPSRAALLEGGYERALSNLFTTEERELVTRDERVVLTLLRAVSETDAEGRVIGTRAMFTDITERQRAEKALAQERNLLLTLVHNAPDPIYVKDTENRFLICNMALARQMGVAAPDELVGKTDFDFHPQEMAVQYYADERILFQSGRPLLNHKERILDRAGNPRWLLTTKVPLQDIRGQIIGLVGMSHDITDLARTEEALERQAARLTLLNEVGGKIASVLELESVLSTAAHLVQESFGYHHVGLFAVDRQRGELVMRAKAGQFVHLFPSDHRIELGKGMVGWTGSHGERLLANDVRTEPRYTNFYPDLIPTRSELCVPIRVGQETVGVLDVQSPQLDAFDQNDVSVMETLAGQIAVAIENARLYEAVQQELAERKQAEEQLQHYSAKLAQSNEELKRFTYTISHDLRAPLVNLKGFSGELTCALEVLRSSLHDILPQLDEGHRSAVIGALLADVPEALGFIDASVTRMDHYINALLKLSRLGRRELVLERVDMEVLAKTTVETLAYQIEQRRARVTVGPLPAVVADRTSMEQIMSNLLNNAVIYLEPGRAGEIEISGERNMEETLLRVRDNGRGIALEDMDKVFAPFRRAGRQDVPGEGMGLAYVQTLVRRHGGRIWCESEPGIGTTFTFTISHQFTQGDPHD